MLGLCNLWMASRDLALRSCRNDLGDHCLSEMVSIKAYLKAEAIVMTVLSFISNSVGLAF